MIKIYSRYTWSNRSNWKKDNTSSISLTFINSFNSDSFVHSMINKIYIDAHYFVHNLSISFSENSPLPVKNANDECLYFYQRVATYVSFFFDISFQLYSFQYQYNIETSMFQIVKNRSTIETLNFHEYIITIYKDYLQL